MKPLHARSCLGVLLLVMLASTWLAYNYAQNQQAAYAALETQRLKLFRLALEETMQNYRETAARLGLLVQQDPAISQAEFAREAEHIYYNHHEIRSLELARNSVISHVYPVQTNETAIGQDLTTLDNARADVLYTLRSQQATLSTPITLLQGGQALVLREPVYVNNQPWGLAILAIDWQKLQRNTGFEVLREHNAGLAVRVRELSRQWQTIHGKAALFTQVDSLVSSLSMPGREWQIALEGKPYLSLLASSDILVLAILLSCVLASLWLVWLLPAARRWTPAASAGCLLLCCSAFLVAQEQSSTDRVLIETLTGGEQVRNRLHTRLKSDRQHLQQLANQLGDGQLDTTMFNLYAQGLRERRADLQSLSLVSPELEVLSRAGTASLEDKIRQPLARQAAHLVRETRLPAYSEVFNDLQGQHVFQLWLPIYNNGKLQGMLVASYALQPLLAAATSAEQAHMYRLTNLHNQVLPGAELHQPDYIQMKLTLPGNGLSLVADMHSQ